MRLKEERQQLGFLIAQLLLLTLDPFGDDSKSSHTFFAVDPGFQKGALAFLGRFL